LRAERNNGVPGKGACNLKAVRTAFEIHGIEFIDQTGLNFVAKPCGVSYISPPVHWGNSIETKKRVNLTSMAVFLWRTLVMLRRYLGIAVGVLMLIWFPGCAANVRFYMITANLAAEIDVLSSPVPSPAKPG